MHMINIRISLRITDAPFIKISGADGAAVMQALSDGQCEAAVIYANELDIYQNSVSANPNCDIIQAGFPIRTIDGSW